MISRILLALALVLTGCSTFTDAELAQIRQRGLRPELLHKMERRQPLAPEDLIELKRAGVRDEHVVKHLEDVGVSYVASREDVSQLRKARVSAWVIDSMLRASERFAARETYEPYDSGWYYGDPWSPYFGSGLEFGYSYSGYRHLGGRGRHHRH